MKKITTILALFSLSVTFAQWNPVLSNASANIFRSGNVGIGYTVAPSVEKFGVKGNSLFSGNLQITSGTNGVSGLQFTNLLSTSTTTAGNGKTLSVDANGNVVLVSLLTLPNNIYTNDGTLLANRIVTMGSKNLTFNPSTANSQFFVNGTTGNIGVGTVSPLSRFHLSNGDFRLDNGKILLGTPFTTVGEINTDWSIKADKGIAIRGALNTPTCITIDNSNTSGVLLLAHAANDYFYSNQSKKGDAIMKSFGNSLIITNESGNFDTACDIKFVTQNHDVDPISLVRMLIDKNGNVGIGTGSNVLSADTKLAVNGLIHTKEVKVDLIGWPDFVFKKNYELPSLKTVENQIKENGHLSNIPSAEEVEANGVKLGEMNKKLLQKVEELTLYLIEMNKEIEVLKQKINKI